MQRVTVIGGTGFIGDYLTEELSGSENVDIKIVYRNTAPGKKIPGIDYLKIDTEKDDEPFHQVLLKTDYLIILSRPDSKLIQRIINSGLTFKKIIYISTLLLYPNSPLKQNEESDLIPINDYERDKIGEERMLIDFAKNSGVKLTIARLTNVYGDIKNRALIHWILQALVKGQEFKVNNNGLPIRDFIFVRDAAKYIRLLTFLDQDLDVEIYNVCTGQGFSINQVIKEAEKVAGRKIKIQKGESIEEKLSVIGDNSKIVKATGFKPEYTLESGLREAYKNYLKN